jgi:transposase
MNQIKKKYSAIEKLKVAAEAIAGHLTQNEITKRYSVHSTQISSWRKLLKHGAEIIFGASNRQSQEDADKNRLIEDLYKEVGKLKYELEWVKKKAELFD